MQRRSISRAGRASFRHTIFNIPSRMEATYNDISDSPKNGSAAAAGDAVGVSRVHQPPRHWYVAVVSNNTEKVCAERLRKLFLEWELQLGRKCEVYVPIQKEMREWSSGRRTIVDRVVLPATLFVRCTEAERRKDIAYLPYIKRFFVNAAGTPVNGHRPVAVVPDEQMISLMRMVYRADSPVTIGLRPLRTGERVRVNGGKLVGLEGNVFREADGSTHLVVQIDILGCAMVKIARDLLDPLTR